MNQLCGVTPSILIVHLLKFSFYKYLIKIGTINFSAETNPSHLMKVTNLLKYIMLTCIFTCCKHRQPEHLRSLELPHVLSGKVVKIVDGDTFDIRIKDSATIRIRLASIDTPEKTQDFYKVAKDALGTYIFGKEVNLKVTGRDRYKRLIAIVLLDGKNINLAMVQSGYAWQYLEYDTSVLFSSAEAEARKNKLGLWSLPNPVSPWDFKHKKKRNDN